MSVLRLAPLAALGLAIAAPASAQGIPRGGRISTSALNNRTKILVANPFVFAAADSATAVHVGDLLRKRMDRAVGSDYSVVPDTIMNTALVQFGYPKDALLSPVLARTLAKNLPGTRVVVTSTLAKAPDGNRVMVARLTGT